MRFYSEKICIRKYARKLPGHEFDNSAECLLRVGEEFDTRSCGVSYKINKEA